MRVKRGLLFSGFLVVLFVLAAGCAAPKHMRVGQPQPLGVTGQAQDVLWVAQQVEVVTEDEGFTQAKRAMRWVIFACNAPAPDGPKGSTCFQTKMLTKDAYRWWADDIARRAPARPARSEDEVEEEEEEEDRPRARRRSSRDRSERRRDRDRRRAAEPEEDDDDYDDDDDVDWSD